MFVFLSKGEGGAYRGRVLVELKTVPTNGIRRPVREAMAKEDEINVEVGKVNSKLFYLRACVNQVDYRRKYNEVTTTVASMLVMHSCRIPD